MTETPHFLEAIAEEPGDTDLRLIYADWLEERNDPRAELIRIQCELETLEPGDLRRYELGQRSEQLLSEHASTWLGHLAEVGQYWEFRRGMLERLTLDVVAFLEHRKTLFEKHPIRFLTLTGDDDSIDELARTPELAKLESLELRDLDLGPASLREFLDSPHLGNLRALYLDNNRLGGEGALLLAKTKSLPSLRALFLGDNDIGPRGAEALGASLTLTDLRRVSLRDNPIGNVGAQMLAASRELHLDYLDLTTTGIENAGFHALIQSDFVSNLTQLHIGDNPLGRLSFSIPAKAMTKLQVLDMSACRLADTIGPKLASMELTHLRHLFLEGNSIGRLGARDLFQVPCLATVQRLDLSGNEIGDEGAELLAECLNLANVRHLHLATNGIRAFGLRPLLDSDKLGSLRSLDLRGNQLGELGIDVLARSPKLAELHRIKLRNTRVDDEGLSHLLGSPNTVKLRSLDLSYNDITNDGLKALVRSTLWTQLYELDISSNEINREPTERQRAKGPTKLTY